MNFFIKLFHCFFCWKIPPNDKGDLLDADVIIGHSFGLRKKDPGVSNQIMGDLAHTLHDLYHLPLVLQWEIADSIPSVQKEFIVREHHIKGMYLDTYESILQLRTFCKKKDWHKAIIIAHPDHYWRCMMVAKKLGFDVIVIDTSSVTYDSLSIQFWTRSAMRFIPREIIARILYLLTDKL